MGADRPTLWLIAGPNGVGKTTYAFRHIRAVSGSTRFVNLDEIARGLSPLDVDAQRLRASRVAIRLTRDLIAARQSFSLETTLAGQSQKSVIAEARAAGMAVHLLYFSVRRVETCLARIARRVSEGGHDIPEADARRRFARSIAALPDYVGRVDLWRLFDANAYPPKVAAEGRMNCLSIANDLSGAPEALAAALSALPPCPE